MNPLLTRILLSRSPLSERRRGTRSCLSMTTLMFLFSFPVGLSAQAVTAEPPDRRDGSGLELLERKIAQYSGVTEGIVGVGAIHLETGQEIFLNRDLHFPMASSYKVPIAVELLRRVDQGELRLDSMVLLTPADISPGSGTLSQLFQHPGVGLSVRNLLELTLLISDNSATDMVLRMAGGGTGVTARMRALGLEEIRVDRSTTRLIADFLGIRNLPPESEVTPEVFSALSAALDPSERDAAAIAFDANPMDTSTPEAMARLLALIWDGSALSSTSSELLLDIMSRSTTGTARISGMLPPETWVAHKTGTIGGTTNDVGIIRLPYNAGNVVMVVFVKESKVDVPTRERAIAEISRSIYDYFLFSREDN